MREYIGIRKAEVRVGEWWKAGARKRRKDQITEEIKQKVHEFFLSAEISRENPSKRYVMEVDGCKVQRHTMTWTLRDAFAAFKDKYPEEKLGFTSFSKASPFRFVRYRRQAGEHAFA